MSEPSQRVAVDPRERFRGCLVGLVVGECLGAPLEGLSALVIQRIHEELTEIRGGGFHGVRPGEHGRNSLIMMRVADSLVELGHFDMDHIVERWVEWKSSESPDLGSTTADALDRIANGTDWHDAGRKVAQSQSASNGAMARVAPLSLYFLNDRNALLQHATELSMATHGNAEALGAAVAISIFLAELARGSKVGESVEVVAATARSRDEPGIASGVRGSSRKELRDLGTSSYCLQTLETSTWCLARTGSFEEAVIRAANLGGGASTNGAVTGALAGAHYGYAAIPPRWTAVIQEHERLLEVSDRLYHLAFPSR